MGAVKIHLHWAYKKNRSLLKTTATGMALCGERHLVKKLMTIHYDDATCAECKRRRNDELRRGDDQATG